MNIIKASIHRQSSRAHNLILKLPVMLIKEINNSVLSYGSLKPRQSNLKEIRRYYANFTSYLNSPFPSDIWRWRNLWLTRSEDGRKSRRWLWFSSSGCLRSLSLVRQFSDGNVFFSWQVDVAHLTPKARRKKRPHVHFSAFIACPTAHQFPFMGGFIDRGQAEISHVFVKGRENLLKIC